MERALVRVIEHRLQSELMTLLVSLTPIQDMKTSLAKALVKHYEAVCLHAPVRACVCLCVCACACI